MRIGITGHQRLPDSSAWPWVRAELDRIVSRAGRPLVGISSLAIGADQEFARSILRHGGRLEAIIPFEGYAARFAAGSDRQGYERLLACAEVTVLPEVGSDEAAYYAAGQRVVDRSDLLIAVWDGQPAAGLGGTGDIVGYASSLAKRVVWINPTSRQVTHPGTKTEAGPRASRVDSDRAAVEPPDREQTT